MTRQLVTLMNHHGTTRRRAIWGGRAGLKALGLFSGLLLLGAFANREIPLILSNTGPDDGAACLAMVLSYHGTSVPLNELRSFINATEDGKANGMTIVETAKRYGLRARGVQVTEAEAIGYLDPATIVHWSDEPGSFPRSLKAMPQDCRFMLFERLRPDRVDLIHPARGRMSVSRDEFMRHFTGVAFIFEAQEPETRAPALQGTGQALFILGLLLAVVSQVQIAVSAFSRSVKLGILCLFVPAYVIFDFYSRRYPSGLLVAWLVSVGLLTVGAFLAF